MRGVMVAIVSGLVTAGCSVFGIRTEAEPAYTVERDVGPVQIRRYGTRIAAETTVTAGEMAARSTGFQRLAGYIFGGNSGSTHIAMTAPVGQSAGQKIAMTAPVDQAQAAPGQWRIRFFMPAEYTLDMLPRPNDPNVVLASVPPETVAVLRYSGLPSAAAVHRAEVSLLGKVEAAGLHADGAPYTWFYDPPWTLPPFRRNEAVVRLVPG